jgi:hypothetical protein
MTNSPFDALTRQLGRTRSRREALSVIASTFVTSVLALSGFGCGGDDSSPSGPTAPTPTPTPTPDPSPVQGGLREISGADAAAATGRANQHADFRAVDANLRQTFAPANTRVWRQQDRAGNTVRTIVTQDFAGGPEGQTARLAHVQEVSGPQVAYALVMGADRRVRAALLRNTTGRVERLNAPPPRRGAAAGRLRFSVQAAPQMCVNCTAICQENLVNDALAFSMCIGELDFDDLRATASSAICAINAMDSSNNVGAGGLITSCTSEGACEAACGSCMPFFACPGQPSVPQVPTICCPFLGSCCDVACCPVGTVCITTGRTPRGDPEVACCTPELDARC